MRCYEGPLLLFGFFYFYVTIPLSLLALIFININFTISFFVLLFHKFKFIYVEYVLFYLLLFLLLIYWYTSNKFISFPNYYSLFYFFFTDWWQTRDLIIQLFDQKSKSNFLSFIKENFEKIEKESIKRWWNLVSNYCICYRHHNPIYMIKDNQINLINYEIYKNQEMLNYFYMIRFRGNV